MEVRGSYGHILVLLFVSTSVREQGVMYMRHGLEGGQSPGRRG